ncbi:transglycosylase SLT domain-containing protein [Ferrimonas gelatinilytica]|uniref:Lytic transglycosylase F n=1 Tax=Ferrimonas gelatinilytica TaxID=1255257 RepID=A0ABP9RU82_9GAMM
MTRSVFLILLLSMLVVACSPAPPEKGAEATPDELPAEQSVPASKPGGAKRHVYRDVWPVLSKPKGGDLPQMLERGEIRLLTSFTLGWFYIDGGQPSGITYESSRLLERFVRQTYGDKADHLKVTVIPVRRDQLISHLLAGHGDLIFANLTITPQRAEQVHFSRPVVDDVRELVVTSDSIPRAQRLSDLVGTPIVVREESSYFQSLEAINAQRRSNGRDLLTAELADPRLEDEDLLEMVASGIITATVVDDHKLSAWLEVLPNLRAHEAVPLRENGQLAVAMRPDSPELEALINDYIAAYPVGGKTANLVIQRYLESHRWITRVMQEEPFENADTLIPLFKKYGERYQFDWVLLMAFAFQESRFDTGARSSVGAVGVMQVMPDTARDRRINIDDIDQDENNIHAGTKYLALLRDTYFDEPGLSEFNRMIFAMAAYNAGPNRLNRMRREAERRGLDPDVWFGNVEHVAAAQIGSETVNYVANIYRYFVSYKRVISEQKDREIIRDRLEQASGDAEPGEIADDGVETP